MRTVLPIGTLILLVMTAFIAANVQQMISRCLCFLIHPLQLEGIKPNPAAAALANIDYQAAHLRLGQFIETRRAFHIFKFASE